MTWWTWVIVFLCLYALERTIVRRFETIERQLDAILDKLRDR